MLAIGLNLFWHWSEKYPGAVPITPFKNYIQRVQFETDHYYSAYPHAATNDVKAAHACRQPLTILRRPVPAWRRLISQKPICNLY